VTEREVPDVATRVQLVFESDTMEGMVAAVRRWLGTEPEAGGPAASIDEARREREMREVLGAIRGSDSRRFVREVAEAAVKGEGIPLDADLRARYGKLGGVVGGPTKLMRRIAHRDLVSRDGDVYRMDPRDARIVVETWSTLTEGHPGPRERSGVRQPGGRGSTGGPRSTGRAEWP
jgi:hypothetical protein